MQSNQQNHSKLLTVLLAGVTSIGFATAASAAGGALGVNTHVGAGAQVSPAPGTSIGGAADARMGASGDLNTNAQWKDTASQGLERAQDRVGTAQDRVSTQAEEMKAQAEELRTQAQTQAEEKRTQAQSLAEEKRTQAQSQAEQLKTQAQEMKPAPKVQFDAKSGTTVNRTARNKR